MKRFSSLFLLFLPLILFSQTDTSSKGIKWTTGHSWEQVKAKAKAENKYIFVDAYATWCKPCKEMDKYVYTSENVSKFINEKFISVRLQLDSTDNDSELVKSWRYHASSIKNAYNVEVLPSFLFFASDGSILHKGQGFLSSPDFVKLLESALNPSTQFYTLLKLYRNGLMDYPSRKSLSLKARELRYPKLANEIARNYIDNYLYKRSDRELMNKDDIEFIANFIKSSKEKGFALFYYSGGEVDSVMQKAFNDSTLKYSESVVDYIISIEEIYVKLFQGLSTNNLKFDRPSKIRPKWKVWENAIAKKYNKKSAERITLDAKLKWYSYKKSWNKYGKLIVEKVEKYGPFGFFSKESKFNQNAWDLFLHCDDKKILQIALAWSDSSIKLSREPVNPEFYDTYANILHKLGRTTEAIVWQEKALMLAPKAEHIAENLAKMIKGQPTWPKQ